MIKKHIKSQIQESQIDEVMIPPFAKKTIINLALMIASYAVPELLGLIKRWGTVKLDFLKRKLETKYPEVYGFIRENPLFKKLINDLISKNKELKNTYYIIVQDGHLSELELEQFDEILQKYLGKENYENFKQEIKEKTK